MLISSAPKRRHIGHRRSEKTKSQQPASQQKKKKGFDQDQALYCTIHDKQDSSHTHTLRRRASSKSRSCSDACPEALCSALDRSAAEGGGALQGARVIGRGGAHGATASRFPVSCKAGARGTAAILVRLPNRARVSQYCAGRANWTMTAIQSKPQRDLPSATTTTTTTAAGC